VFSPLWLLIIYNDPKYFVLHLIAAVVVVAWAFEWAAGRREAGPWKPATPWGWAGRRPERWAVVSVVVFAAAAVISTLVSPAPRVSLWGRDNITLGYELYTFLALLVVFFAVALRLRTLDQVGRVFLVLMVAGGITALYGISQDFGWDPLSPGEDGARSLGTFGNPIFFGAFLLMSLFATVAVAVKARRARQTTMLVVAIVILGIELTGLWSTQSRGPLYGTALGMIAFGVIGAIWLNRSTLKTGAGVIAAGIVIALAISLIPNAGAGGPSGGGRSLEDLGNIFDTAEATSLGGRAATWGGALELATSWERYPEESGLRHALRPIFGLGPDMYFYSYPLSVDRDPSGTGKLFAHVHNLPMQVLLELGFVGFGSFLALVLLVAYTAVMVLRAEKSAGRGDGLVSIFTALLLAALVGRAVEQMAGVAHVSDQLTFWVMAGLIVGLAGISARSRGLDPVVSTRPLPTGSRRDRRQRAAASQGVGALLPMGLAALVLLLVIGLFFVRDIRGIAASRAGAQGLSLVNDDRGEEGFKRFERAIELNSDVEWYVSQANTLIRRNAEAPENSAVTVQLYELSLSILEKYEDRDPFAQQTQRNIAQTELSLGRLGQTEMFVRAIERYQRLAEERRSFQTVQALVGDGIVAAGGGFMELGDEETALSYTVLALVYADRAIALETAAQPSPRAWWVRGIANERLGNLNEALSAYLESVSHERGTVYESQSHLGLARVYGMLGDPENAEKHRLLSEGDG
jgi:O-antigen ligase/tetratricopeptide (TPR) repeat protein